MLPFYIRGILYTESQDRNFIRNYFKWESSAKLMNKHGERSRDRQVAGKLRGRRKNFEVKGQSHEIFDPYSLCKNTPPRPLINRLNSFANLFCFCTDFGAQIEFFDQKRIEISRHCPFKGTVSPHQKTSVKEFSTLFTLTFKIIKKKKLFQRLILARMLKTRSWPLETQLWRVLGIQ